MQTLRIEDIHLIYLVRNAPERERIAEDMPHSEGEERLYCIGRVDDGIMTVRFTFRGEKIRIFGAGYWRKGRKLYEKKNKIH